MSESGPQTTSLPQIESNRSIPQISSNRSRISQNNIEKDLFFLRQQGINGSTDHLKPSIVNAMKGSLRKRVAEMMLKAENGEDYEQPDKTQKNQKGQHDNERAEQNNDDNDQDVIEVEQKTTTQPNTHNNNNESHKQNYTFVQPKKSIQKKQLQPQRLNTIEQKELSLYKMSVYDYLKQPQLFLWNLDRSLNRFLDEEDIQTLNQKMTLVDTRRVTTVQIVKQFESLLLVSLLNQISDSLERDILAGKRVRTVYLADMRKAIRVLKQKNGFTGFEYQLDPVEQSDQTAVNNYSWRLFLAQRDYGRFRLVELQEEQREAVLQGKRFIYETSTKWPVDEFVNKRTSFEELEKSQDQASRKKIQLHIAGYSELSSTKKSIERTFAFLERNHMRLPTTEQNKIAMQYVRLNNRVEENVKMASGYGMPSKKQQHLRKRHSVQYNASAGDGYQQQQMYGLEDDYQQLKSHKIDPVVKQRQMQVLKKEIRSIDQLLKDRRKSEVHKSLTLDPIKLKQEQEEEKRIQLNQSYCDLIARKKEQRTLRKQQSSSMFMLHSASTNSLDLEDGSPIDSMKFPSISMIRSDSKPYFSQMIVNSDV